MPLAEAAVTSVDRATFFFLLETIALTILNFKVALWQFWGQLKQHYSRITYKDY